MATPKCFVSDRDFREHRFVVATTQHWVSFDEPTARSPHVRLTVCGEWVGRDQVAGMRDGVTCPTCLRELEHFDNLEL